MNLNELRYVVAVARERHFGRAAEACFVTQPTLSVAVRKLEEELGVKIFERRRNDVRITPIGEQVVAQAQRVLEEVERLRNIARQGQDPLLGPLRLGAIYTIGPYLIPPLIPVLAEMAPEMPLVIEENYTARLTEKLKRGELDAILIALPWEESGCDTLPLYEEPFVVLIPASHPWRERKQIRGAELAGEELLLLGSGHCFRDQVLQACPQCNRSAESGLQQSVEGGSLETIRHMVASGLGITVLPCTAAGADSYTRRLVEIRRFAPPAPSRTVAIAWRKGYPREEAVRTVARAIRAVEMSCVRYLDDDSQ